TNLFDYCYSFEKIISRNSLEKRKNLSKRVKIFAENISMFGTSKTKGTLANKIIEDYKNSKKSLIIKFVPTKFYCFAGYWIEQISPGTFASIFYEKSKKTINQYNDIKKEVDEFFRDINSEYKSIKKEIDDLF
ncbi:carbon storage regulator CsrA, partial [uncultured Prochlorococcus sp.]|uniref:carbon storage regulator CsrA n=1 Tax=uncultured Prochlorococcus sp. TaxID=159733 RepID=UPI00258D7690